MSDLPARYTIERRTVPAFRGPSGQPPKRFLGHTDRGPLIWMPSFVHANTFKTLEEAESFVEHRLADEAAQVVQHTMH